MMNGAVVQLLAIFNLVIADMFTGFMKSSVLFRMVGLTLSFSHSPPMLIPDGNPPTLTGTGMESGTEQKFWITQIIVQSTGN